MKRLWVVILFAAAVCRADTFIVDDDGLADFLCIQEALDWAWHGDVIVVRPGIYPCSSLRTYGKEVTVRSEAPDDWETVDATIIDGSSAEYAIAFDHDETERTLLEGFTVRGGTRAAILLSSKAVPPIRACHFVDSPNVRSGGTGLRFERCSFEGMVLHLGTSEVLDCRFVQCRLYFVEGLVQGCHIVGQPTRPVIQNVRSGAVLQNCVICGGLSGIEEVQGGQIINCTIVGNREDGIRGSFGHVSNSIIALNGGYGITGSVTSVYNNVWGNSLGSYSHMTPSQLDIHTNPGFVDDGHWTGQEWIPGDDHLRSQAGRYDPQTGSWVADTLTSRCIDAGYPDSEIGEEPNPNGGRINMGAYGGTAEASKSPSGTIVPVCENPPQMDFTGDCRVTLLDFAEFAGQWLACGLDVESACWE